MTDDRSIAREVHALLLSAHPELEDINLAKAARLASSNSNETVKPCNDFRGDTFVAIQLLSGSPQTKGVESDQCGSEVSDGSRIKRRVDLQLDVILVSSRDLIAAAPA